MTRFTGTIGALMLALVIGLPAAAAAQQQPDELPPGEPPVEAATPALEVEAADTPAPPDTRRAGRRPLGRSVFRVGSNYVLREGDEIPEVVVVSGDATIGGRVYGDVIVIAGAARLRSTAEVDGSLVVIAGRAVISPGAEVDRDLVVVGGALDAPPDFVPGQEYVTIGLGALRGPLQPLVPWLARGPLWGRLIVPDLPWIWTLVALAFLFSLALNAVFHRPVRTCVDALEGRPLTTFLVGLLVLLLAGPLFLLLAVSIVGLLVVPFAAAALLLAWVVGRIAVARWIGSSMVPEAVDSSAATGSSRSLAVRSFVIGFVVLCIAYAIPVVGLVTWIAVGIFGLGAATLAFMGGYRRENVRPRRDVTPPAALAAAPAPAVVYSPPPPPPAHPQVAYEDTSGAEPFPFVDSTASPRTATAEQPVTPTPPATPLAPTDLIALPHASFRDRLAAFVLDVILVSVAVGVLELAGPGGDRRFLLLLLAYHVGFWTWKGTTVGGIILQLRLVRVNGEPLRFVDALVRGLSSILSLVVVGLGALWILFDPERQAWHDKVAATYVVKVPRNYPL